MHDMLRETPIYQEILKEGREEGLEKGLEQGLQRGQLEALRQAVIDVVVERFPKLGSSASLARGPASVSRRSSRRAMAMKSSKPKGCFALCIAIGEAISLSR